VLLVATPGSDPQHCLAPPPKCPARWPRAPQDEGNYRAAHAKLLRALRQLSSLGARAPQELVGALALAHSYVLVRSLIALDDHAGAARLLARVAASISR
jgi:WD repeat-containing protein 19